MEQKSTQVGFRCPDDLLAAVDQLAEEDHRKRSAMIILLLQRAIEWSARMAAHAKRGGGR